MFLNGTVIATAYLGLVDWDDLWEINGGINWVNALEEKQASRAWGGQIFIS